MQRFNRRQLYQLIEAGALDGLCIELINGQLVEKIREGNVHGATRGRLESLLEPIFGKGYWLRVNGTLDLSDWNVVDPDIAVTFGDCDNPEDDNPSTALLVVEIGETTLWFDRTTKASMYAAAGIADYWIVNMHDRQLEIRRDPQPNATAEFGHGYGSLVTLKPGADAIPLAMPGGKVPVDKLFF